MKKDFPGTIFLVIGNSGSGKDSIMMGAIERLPPELKEAFLTKRYITRPPSEFEDNYTITTEKFQEMDKQGKFALKWHIYHLDYGVPIEIDDWLKEGHPVFVNVSRTVVDVARELYENIKIIFIEVPFEITLQRVKNRGREKGELLQERIDRAKENQSFPSADYIVDNSGDLDNAINQFLNDVEWGHLDFLVVDLPPGTSDETISILQLLKDSKAIVVTTPQDVALMDSRKAITMAIKMMDGILGVVENMSGYVCPHCGKDIDIFGKDGGKNAAAEMGVPFLGAIPIDPDIRKDSDKGSPYVVKHAEAPAKKAFDSIVKNIKNELKLK